MSTFTPSQPFIIQPEQGPPLPSQTMGMPGPLPVARIAAPRGGNIDIGGLFSGAASTFLDFAGLRQQSGQYQQSLTQRKFEFKQLQENKKRIQFTNLAVKALELQLAAEIVFIKTQRAIQQDKIQEKLSVEKRMERTRRTVMNLERELRTAATDSYGKLAEHATTSGQADAFKNMQSAGLEVIGRLLDPDAIKDADRKTTHGLEMAEPGEGALAGIFFGAVHPVTGEMGTMAEFADRVGRNFDAGGGLISGADWAEFWKADTTKMAIEGKPLTEFKVDAETGYPLVKGFDAYAIMSAAAGATIDQVSEALGGKVPEEVLLKINTRLRDESIKSVRAVQDDLRDKALEQLRQRYGSEASLNVYTRDVDTMEQVINDLGFLQGSAARPTGGQQISQALHEGGEGIIAGVGAIAGLVSDKAESAITGLNKPTDLSRGILGVYSGTVPLQGNGWSWDQRVVGGESKAPELRAFMELEFKRRGLGLLNNNDLIHGVSFIPGTEQTESDRLKVIGWSHAQNVAEAADAGFNPIRTKTRDAPFVSDALGEDLLRDTLNSPGTQEAIQFLIESGKSQGLPGDFAALMLYASARSMAEQVGAIDPSQRWIVKGLEQGNPHLHAAMIIATNREMSEFLPDLEAIRALPTYAEKLEAGVVLQTKMWNKGALKGLVTFTDPRSREMLSEALKTGTPLTREQTLFMYGPDNVTLINVPGATPPEAPYLDFMRLYGEGLAADTKRLDREIKQGKQVTLPPEMPLESILGPEAQKSVGPVATEIMRGIYSGRRKILEGMFPPPDEAPTPQEPLLTDLGTKGTQTPTSGPSAGGAPPSGLEQATSGPATTQPAPLPQLGVAPPVPKQGEPLQVQSVLGQ